MDFDPCENHAAGWGGVGGEFSAAVIFRVDLPVVGVASFRICFYASSHAPSFRSRSSC